LLVRLIFSLGPSPFLNSEKANTDTDTDTDTDIDLQNFSTTYNSATYNGYKTADVTKTDDNNNSSYSFESARAENDEWNKLTNTPSVYLATARPVS
jgi:hypothetical protein